MDDRPDIETPTDSDPGAGVPAPEAVVRLYREAFAAFGPLALWDRRPIPHPTLAQALGVAARLRREGSMATRPLALRLEAACRAAV